MSLSREELIEMIKKLPADKLQLIYPIVKDIYIAPNPINYLDTKKDV